MPCDAVQQYKDNTATVSPHETYVYAGLANAMEDIVTYAAKALIDPRTENKRVIIRTEANMASQHDLIALWERISCKKVTSNYMSAEELDRQIEGMVGTLADDMQWWAVTPVCAIASQFQYCS